MVYLKNKKDLMKIIFKVILILKFFFSKNVVLSFKSPPHKKLLLVDNIAEKYLKDPILNSYDYTSICTRPGFRKSIFYFNLKLVFFFILGLIKNLNFKNSYVFACIKCIKPSLVLENTFDHNLIFLAKLFPNIEFIYLTQGIWFNILPDGKKVIQTSFPESISNIKIEKLSNIRLFLWGQKDIDLFENLGVNKHNKIVKLVKVGSWQGSYYKNFENKFKISRDLLFISQLNKSFFNSEREEHKIIYQNTISSLKLLISYAYENNLSLAYFCRCSCENDEEEVELINSIPKRGIRFELIKHKNIFGVWEETFKSEIILSNYSTVAHDAMVFQKKTVLMPLYSKNIFEWFSLNSKFKDDKDFWKWTLYDDNINNFSEIMDDIRNISMIDYKKMIKSRIEYLSNTELKKPSYQIIRDYINEKV